MLVLQAGRAHLCVDYDSIVETHIALPPRSQLVPPEICVLSGYQSWLLLLAGRVVSVAVAAKSELMKSSPRGQTYARPPSCYYTHFIYVFFLNKHWSVLGKRPVSTEYGALHIKCLLMDIFIGQYIKFYV